METDFWDCPNGMGEKSMSRTPGTQFLWAPNSAKGKEQYRIMEVKGRTWCSKGCLPISKCT